MADTSSINDMFDEIPEAVIKHPAWVRLCNQVSWYESKSAWNQKWYKFYKILQVFFASIIPIALLADVNKITVAFFGSIITILEAIQQIYRFHELWIQFRSTSEHLKHHQFLFLSKADIYKGMETEVSLILLSEKVEEMVSAEHAQWIRISKKDEATTK